MKRKIRSVEKTPQANDELPNLSLPLPFVHCKIVFNLKEKVSDKVDSKRFPDKSILEGWKFENNRYVYYDTVASDNEMIKNKHTGKPTSTKIADTSEESGADSDDDDIFTASFLKLINRKEEKEASLKYNTSAAAPRTAALESYQYHIEKKTSSLSSSATDPNFSKKTTENNVNVFNITAKNSVARSKTDQKLFKCSFCSKSFTAKGSLKVHLRIHTGEKPYQCLKCLKRFSQLATLNLHMRIHTGEKPLQCSECSKRFSDPSSFKRHMRLHTGERLFKCPECLKTFSQSSSLKIHLRLHTGEKPFLCLECLQRFSDPSSFKRHVRIHTCKKS